MQSITELLKVYPGDASLAGGVEDVTVQEITADSRQVTPGGMFVVIRGEKRDGADFLPDALERGAKIIVTEQLLPDIPKQQACQLVVDNARRALSLFAALLYAPQPEHVVAVTGTDGKTSTAEFFRQLAQGAGHPSASIGTLGVRSNGETLDVPALNTTPDPVLMQKTLQRLAEKGCDHVAIEASSHGLAQFRLDGVRFRAAAFTNFASDHLDYHQTLAHYFDAKKRLFSEVLPEEGVAVLNRDDAKYPMLEEICRQRRVKIMTFGWHDSADLRCIRRVPTLEGQEVELMVMGRPYACAIGLVGEFQIMNILTAAGLAHACGLEIEALVKQFPQLHGVPGRLEKVAVHPSGAVIYIDYAHTEDALTKLLETLRPHTEGRLLVVFGCGGDRDRSKRPRMGAAAARLADEVVVTDDNPRSEDPDGIRAEVMSGCESAKNIGDRGDAIAYAVGKLRCGDVLVIAGKGHEKTQLVGDRVIPFDDAQIARQAVGACAA